MIKWLSSTLSQDITRTLQVEISFRTIPVDKWTDCRFLDLMASSPASFFVPTLDIDLAWHTHQLMAKNYRTDCTTYVGRFIDQ